jgi:VanZ family protein
MTHQPAGLLTRGLRAFGRTLLGAPWPLGAVLVLGWAFVIFDISSHSRPFPTAKSAPWEFLSNLAHAPLFGILTLFLAALVLRERDAAWPRARPFRRALVVLLVLTYGISDEWHQSHTPGRDASVFDVLTDVTGALCVLWIIATLARAELREGTLVARLALGVLACLTSAAIASVF